MQSKSGAWMQIIAGGVVEEVVLCCRRRRRCRRCVDIAIFQRLPSVALRACVLARRKKVEQAGNY